MTDETYGREIPGAKRPRGTLLTAAPRSCSARGAAGVT